MKNFFSRNRRMVEIILTLLLVFLAGGYYYLIYIPIGENEIIERRFRTLRKTELNIADNFKGYISSIKNCLSKSHESFFSDIVKGYNKSPEKFRINVVTNERITGKILLDSLTKLMNDSVYEEFKVKSESNGKKLIIHYIYYELNVEKKQKSNKGNNKDSKKNKTAGKPGITHIVIDATIDYKEFIIPLLKKNVFEHYLVLNVFRDTSNIVYEDFPSGFSFRNLDSIFDAKEKVYSSRIVNIETGGEKYLAFLHPCGYNNKNDRILIGLLNQDTFDSEKRKLPERMVTMIFFISIFSFLLLPVIRLALMGKKERIRILDLFAGYFSFLLFIPVIILIFFWNNKSFLSDAEIGDHSKQVLANEISRRLNAEINAAYNLVDGIDFLYANDALMEPLQTTNVRNLSGDAQPHFFEEEERKNEKRIKAAVSNLKDYVTENDSMFKGAEYIFWMNAETGKEIANWAFGQDPPRGKYNDREYYKNVKEGNLVSLQNDPLKTFAIEPVISRIDGRFKVVLAKNSRKKGLIIASPCRFESVMGPVIPDGFSFTVIDSTGKTIFDADSTHNLNENLLEEFTNPGGLRTVLDKQISNEFRTRYEDEDYLVVAQPVGKLPYFILVFESEAYRSSLNTQCFSFTMMMMLSYFIFLCLEILIILICHHSPSKLLKNKIDFSWVHPRESLSHKYFMLSVFNGCVLVLLLFFCFIDFSIHRVTEYIFLFMAAALLSTIAAGIFPGHSEAKKLEVKRKSRSKRNALVALSVLAVIVMADSVRYKIQGTILMFSLIMTCLFLILYFIDKLLLKSRKSKEYLVHFRFMIFSKFLVVSGLPVIVLFICSYNFEWKLAQRLKLLDYAKKVELHLKAAGLNVDLENDLLRNCGGKICYLDSGWISKMEIVRQPDTSSALYSYSDSICLRLLKISRVHYNEISGRTENFELIRPFASDSDHFVYNSIFDSVPDKLRYRINSTDGISNYIELTSSEINAYKTPSIASAEGFTFWLFFIGALIFCYQLLKYALNKIFGKISPDVDQYKKMDANLLKDKRIKHLFVQGIPGSDKKTFIHTHLTANNGFVFFDKCNPEKEYNAKIFSMDEIPDEKEYELEIKAYEKQQESGKLNKDNWFSKIEEMSKVHVECIVFSHFEYMIFDRHTNRIKLNLIEDLMRYDRKKIIISSDMDPVEYFHSMKMFAEGKTDVNAAAAEAGNKNKGDKTGGQESGTAFIEYMNRWINILGRFTNIYTDNNTETAKADPSGKYQDDFLMYECGHPVFLNKYKPEFGSFAENEDMMEDNILKIQGLSDHSYRQIWDSLTKEEQLTLYDLSEDGLINTTNYMSLTRLLNKGLIIKNDGILMLMNRSFRNFILTVVNTDEIWKIEKEVSDGQTWNDYKYPVLIILGALIYFVLSSNPEKFGNVLPVISGVMAGIPTVLKLLSYLKPAESK
jgi:hypothetical protein